jgi:hypothetical protein
MSIHSYGRVVLTVKLDNAVTGFSLHTLPANKKPRPDRHATVCPPNKANTAQAQKKFYYRVNKKASPGQARDSVSLNKANTAQAQKKF